MKHLSSVLLAIGLAGTSSVALAQSGGVQIETVLIDRGPGPLVVQWGPP